MRGYEDPSTLPIHEVHDRIVTLNNQLSTFWSRAEGWAPSGASQILSAARLDWQVELSRSLRLWTQQAPTGETQARLILGWSNLGALVEGTLKLLLSVWADTYSGSSNAKTDRKGITKLPDVLKLEDLRQFVVAEDLVPRWHTWIGHVQTRRNAIHAFRDRELGTLEELKGDVAKYLAFLREVNLDLPYPDDRVPPNEIDFSEFLASTKRNREASALPP